MPLPPLENPQNLARRLSGMARGLPAVTLLGSMLLALNAVQTAAALMIPFSHRRFRALNRALANLYWGWCTSAAELVHGVSIDISGDPVPARESAIVVVNHQQMADIPFLLFLARDKDRLGDMKWIVKDIIKYVPGVGWGMYFLDCFFVKRDWTRDRKKIEATFSRIKKDNVPLWLVTFVEGTRISPQKIERSRDFAAEKGLQPLDHLLIPRTKGFAASVVGLRDHVDAIYDVTIGYSDGVPSLWQYIKGLAPGAHLHVRRFGVEEMPSGEDEIANWLHERFCEKDRLLDHFYTHGRFPS